METAAILHCGLDAVKEMLKPFLVQYLRDNIDDIVIEELGLLENKLAIRIARRDGEPLSKTCEWFEFPRITSTNEIEPSIDLDLNRPVIRLIAVRGDEAGEDSAPAESYMGLTTKLAYAPYIGKFVEGPNEVKRIRTVMNLEKFSEKETEES